MKTMAVTLLKTVKQKLALISTLVIFTLLSNVGIGQVNPPAPPAPKSAIVGCTPESGTCPQGSFSASFSSGAYYSGGRTSTSAGAVWRYANVTNIGGLNVNATIKIDTIYNATVTNFDDDNAKDQNNVSVAKWFAPRIAPDNATTSSKRGYVQFTITFYKDNVGNGYTETAELLGLNYTHYDIDGASGSGYTFREIGMVQSVSQLVNVAANAKTELVPYNYTIADKNWTGFASSTSVRNGLTTCSEVVASFKYNPLNNPVSSMSIRMGYEYVRTSGNGYGNEARLYASNFSCFNFPQETTLPVKLLSFGGNYQNKISQLNWEVVNENNFSHYEIERSTNGISYLKAGDVNALGANEDKRQYKFSDDLSAVSGDVFYYRLKMVDIDGKAKYSNIIIIRRDQQNINGLSIAPNPVSNGMTTVRFSSVGNQSVELKVIDLSGRIVFRQQNQVFKGTNSLSLNNLDKLSPGIYILQLNDGVSVSNSRFSIMK